MVDLRAGEERDATSLAPLILLSADKLLPYIFGSSKHALVYLAAAAAQQDGQYSAVRHYLASSGGNLIGCMCLWHDNMPLEFHQSTVKRLTDFLSKKQLEHIIKINSTLATLFLAPQSEELCIGHLAVNEAWQGKQVASKLMNYAVRQAKLLNKSKLVLDVDTANHGALAFYEKWDFIQKKQQKFIPTQQTFVRMQRVLD
jgi:ribosomal protein S18 acetylase RimI-like enzyme